jgi:glycosyltransferase involved in cell wall biosynthesis
MNALIVEPNGDGHHMALYVRYVARRLLDEGCDLSLLTTASAVNHPSFNLVKKGLGRDIDLYFLPENQKAKSSSWFLLASQIRMWFDLKRTFARIASLKRVDIVYIPTIDWIAKAIELLGTPFETIPFVALYMSPKHHLKTMGLGPPSRHDWLYDRLFLRLLSIPTLRRILVIDEFFFEFCHRSYGAMAKKVMYAPDFGEIRGEGTKDESRASLGIPEEARVLLVYGSLTRRKGIAQLLEAFCESANLQKITLLFAGKADSEIQEMMMSPVVQPFVKNGRIITRLTFHNDDDEFRVFSAADLVWIGYSSGFYGSSGVLYQAIFARLPILAMELGLIGSTVRKHCLGIDFDVEKRKSIESALLRSKELHWRKIEQGKEYSEFAKLHTNEQHTSIVISEMLGKSCCPPQ